MTEESNPKLPSGQVLKWSDDAYPSYYANIMALGMSAFDITVQFGEISAATVHDVIGKPKAKIVLSPEQAFNLSNMLGLIVERYVQTNGPLRTGAGFSREAFLEALEENTVRPEK
jgi:hypothetical protein